MYSVCDSGLEAFFCNSSRILRGIVLLKWERPSLKRNRLHVLVWHAVISTTESCLYLTPSRLRATGCHSRSFMAFGFYMELETTDGGHIVITIRVVLKGVTAGLIPITHLLYQHVPRGKWVRGRVFGQLLWRSGKEMAQLCGPGGDAESGLHHRFLPAQCHNTAARYPHGQVWSTSNSAGGQVMIVK